jgi:hypothetical protein
MAAATMCNNVAAAGMCELNGPPVVRAPRPQVAPEGVA